MARTIEVDITINAESCQGCSLCVGSCPKDIIAISTDKLNAKGYHPAEVTDAEQCNACGNCSRICPDVAIRIEKRDIDGE